MFSRNPSVPTIAQKNPYRLDVEQGKTYLWCACGLSKTQPMCDGSHKGSGFKPVAFTASETEEVWFCGCKHSKTAPMCDGTHNTL
ncbi:MAG: CDGSH iron-sulfur domain-containing protein [Candidatus Sungbacteria bacterium]|uniref:CDGSH iron-sulfur domain-containing protein n=1 Tax=Candidatus Sungiibacteriota bacterium TaxID=2750080 RepID=A0A932QXV5_9BACT|nr:CDGSH iron-sulfur domain-containing protein [Candidatus Sungbacteria bacterium]